MRQIPVTITLASTVFLWCNIHTLHQTGLCEYEELSYPGELSISSPNPHMDHLTDDYQVKFNFQEDGLNCKYYETLHYAITT